MLTHLTDGRTLVIFGMKTGDVIALDVGKHGATVWRDDHTNRNRGTIWGAALDADYAYVSCAGNGIAALSLTDGRRKWCAPLDTTVDPKVQYTAALTAIPGVLFVEGHRWQRVGSVQRGWPCLVEVSDGDALRDRQCGGRPRRVHRVRRRDGGRGHAICRFWIWRSVRHTR